MGRFAFLPTDDMRPLAEILDERMSRLCECGCGKPTLLARMNDRSKGWVKGAPLRFVDGHSGRVVGLLRPRPPIGARRLSTHGYVEIKTASSDWQYEHILVAERALGRPLKFISTGHPDNEVVHHVHADKTNNVGSNLLICTHAYHTALHHRLEQSPCWPEFPPIVRFTGARHV